MHETGHPLLEEIRTGSDPVGHDRIAAGNLRQKLIKHKPNKYETEEYIKARNDAARDKGTGLWAGAGDAGEEEFGDMADMLQICICIFTPFPPNPEYPQSSGWMIYCPNSEGRKGHLGACDANIASQDVCPNGVAFMLNSGSGTHFETLVPRVLQPEPSRTRDDLAHLPRTHQAFKKLRDDPVRWGELSPEKKSKVMDWLAAQSQQSRHHLASISRREAARDLPIEENPAEEPKPKKTTLAKKRAPEDCCNDSIYDERMRIAIQESINKKGGKSTKNRKNRKNTKMRNKITQKTKKSKTFYRK